MDIQLGLTGATLLIMIIDYSHYLIISKYHI